MFGAAKAQRPEPIALARGFHRREETRNICHQRPLPSLQSLQEDGCFAIVTFGYPGSTTDLKRLLTLPQGQTR